MNDEHPEKVDPVWMQVLVRRALEKEMSRLAKEGNDEYWIETMWYVFDIRNNLLELYKAAND